MFMYMSHGCQNKNSPDFIPTFKLINPHHTYTQNKPNGAFVAKTKRIKAYPS